MQDEQATTIGESIFVTGALSGHEDLTVLGRVEGTIHLSKTLFVAESGIVKADVAVDDAVISGIVVGNVTATNSVQITETGRLLGDLRAPRIIVVAGARVRGQVDMSSAKSAAGKIPRPEQAGTQSHSTSSATSVSRNAHGRFERLSLPARRPMPQAPAMHRQQPQSHATSQQSAAEAHAGQAHKARSTEPTARRGQNEGEEPVHEHAHASRRPVSAHNKKRAAARRRD